MEENIPLMRDSLQIIGLQNLCKWANENKINNIAVEIGAYSGEGTMILSEYFKSIITIDPWKNGYDKDDLASEQWPMNLIFKNFIKKTQNIKNIKYLPTSSEKAVKFFNEESIDFIYIDGDHRYDFILKDLTLWKSKMKKYSIISGHDFSFPSVKKALKDIFSNKEFHLFEGDSWAFIL